MLVEPWERLCNFFSFFFSEAACSHLNAVLRKLLDYIDDKVETIVVRLGGRSSIGPLPSHTSRQ